MERTALLGSSHADRARTVRKGAGQGLAWEQVGSEFGEGVVPRLYLFQSDGCGSRRVQMRHACLFQGDVRSYADCERAVQQTLARFGRLDILVNCAAGNFLATAEELTSNGFRTGVPFLQALVPRAHRERVPHGRASSSAPVLC